MDKKEKYISLFSALGERLMEFGADERSRSIASEASAANPWFGESDIYFAVDALCRDMLREEILRRWLDEYELTYSHIRSVAVVMAGNIPMVGFHDLMCVIACGHECYIKPSSKDSILMRYITEQIRNIDPDVPVFDYSPDGSYDGVIATGSDNTNRYFREIFSSVPSLLRSSRSSAAVLTGSETEADLAGLSEDIFRYGGLGCRNVSLLFVPAGYDISSLPRWLKPQGSNAKLRNNYLQTRALLELQGRRFTDGDGFVLTEEMDFSHTLSRVNYAFYDRPEEVRRWLAGRETEIQTVVCQGGMFVRESGFGRAQHPAPWDYPDGEDVVRFLISF